jgi:hypothetical protein
MYAGVCCRDLQWILIVYSDVVSCIEVKQAMSNIPGIMAPYAIILHYANSIAL